MAGARRAAATPIRIGLASSARCRRISAGAVWSGPDLAAAGDWGKDFEAAALAQKLASRRTSLEEADRLIDAFAKRQATRTKPSASRAFSRACSS